MKQNLKEEDVDVSKYLPYSYRINKKQQFLYVVGVAHLYDIKFPQFKVIRSNWKDFLKVTKGKNCIVLVEGGKSRIFSNERIAVAEAGENGFITYLAFKKGIETFSPEPSEEYEINYLIKKFTKDQIMFYYFSRLYIQWFNAYKPMEFNNYIQRQFDLYKKILDWSDYDFRVKNFIKIHDERRDHKFNKDKCIRCLYDFDPDIKDVEDNSVKLRDRYIFKEICEFWDNGKNIFIVYGGVHVEQWESTLKKRLLD